MHRGKFLAAIKFNIMSKDRGTKNVKKAPADKSLGSLKKESAYKSEKNSGQSSQSNIKVFVPKDDNKKGG